MYLIIVLITCTKFCMPFELFTIPIRHITASTENEKDGDGGESKVRLPFHKASWELDLFILGNLTSLIK